MFQGISVWASPLTATSSDTLAASCDNQNNNDDIRLTTIRATSTVDTLMTISDVVDLGMALPPIVSAISRHDVEAGADTARETHTSPQ